MSKHFCVCAICGNGVGLTDEQFANAKDWGFFVCGIADTNHLDENFVRKTILETKINRTVRKDLKPPEVVDLDLEIGM